MDNGERINAAFATMDEFFQGRAVIFMEGLARLSMKIQMESHTAHPKVLFLVPKPIRQIDIHGNVRNILPDHLPVDRAS